MAHASLAHLVAQHPGGARLRKRRGRRLRAIRASRRVELWYRAQLLSVVRHLAVAGKAIADALERRWPAPAADARTAADETERVPGLTPELERAAAKFGNIKAVAERLTNVADRLSLVRRGLADVDARLIKEIRRSVSVDITHLLSDHGPIREAMQRTARENVELIVSIPKQYLDGVRKAVEDAFAKGQRWEEVAKAIAHVGDVTATRARIIARDQAGKMNADFNEARQTSLGIEEYDWRGCMDKRERPSHRAMEGTRCRWDSPPLVDGEHVHPGKAILCRCGAQPVINLDRITFGGQPAAEAA